MLKDKRKLQNMIIFFGDSLTSGENNNFQGFVEKMNKDNCWNVGVSGTCIGDYSLYPVGATNLIQQLYKTYLKNASTVILEYGSNDISSIVTGYVNLTRVEIELIKSVDFIKQQNPDAQIFFILLGKNKNKMAKAQCDYLNNDYIKAPHRVFSSQEWVRIYDIFEDFVKNLLYVIELPMLDDDDIDVDGIHPNDKGYKKIAEKIKCFLENTNKN
jgi:lysophospholipase L1-like esterase